MSNKRKAICLLLLLDEEEDDEILRNEVKRKRKSHHELFRSREKEGFFNVLINKRLKNDEEKFRQFFRLNQDQFLFVSSLIERDLKKEGTHAVKNPITAEEKVAVTLRYMATGESFRSLAFAFRISHSYISVIIKDTLNAMCRHLISLFLPSPNLENLKENSREFLQKWNFPHCVAAIDGKHIRIFCPDQSGSLFFNYKDYFSLVLLAMVDANSRFVAVDVGSYGKEGDSGIFAKSAMGRQVYSGNFFPPNELLAGLNKPMPYVILGDEAFRLHKHVMKPYTKAAAHADKTKAIFNYRLSRARRLSENAFGLLCQVFRVFFTPIAIKPETCDKLVLAACCLHNLLRDAYLEKTGQPYYHYDPNVKPPTGLVPLTRTGGFANYDGFQIRDDFKTYFNQMGAVEWQNYHVNRLSST